MDKLSSAALVAEARSQIEHMAVEEVNSVLANTDFIVVDIRDSAELASGYIPGSVHSHRGGLEFALDSGSELRNEQLTSGATLIMVCGSGGRAALATKLALDFGHSAVCMQGGMKAWREAAYALESPVS